MCVANQQIADTSLREYNVNKCTCIDNYDDNNDEENRDRKNVVDDGNGDIDVIDDEDDDGFVNFVYFIIFIDFIDFTSFISISILFNHLHKWQLIRTS